MKHLLFSSLFLIVAMAASAATLTNRLTQPFNKVVVEKRANVQYMITSGAPTVKITAPDNIIKYVKYKFDGKTLKFYIQDFEIKKSDDEKTHSISFLGMTVSWGGNDYPKDDNISKLLEKVTITLSAPMAPVLEAEDLGAINVRNSYKSTGAITLEADDMSSISLQGVECKSAKITADNMSSIKIQTLKCSNEAKVTSDSMSSIAIDKLQSSTLNARSHNLSSLAIKYANTTTLVVNSSSMSSLNVAGKWEELQRNCDSMSSLNMKRK